MGASLQGMHLSGSLHLGLDNVLYEHGLKLVVSASYFIVRAFTFQESGEGASLNFAV